MRRAWQTPLAPLPRRAQSLPSTVFAVRLEGLTMRFGRGRQAVTALDRINAVAPAGRITGLVGPDAAGKTTLMRILAGLMPPTAGSVRIFGQEPQALLRAQPNSIGYMPQRFGLYEDISVLANLRLHASLRGLTGAAREALLPGCWTLPPLPRLRSGWPGGFPAA